MKTVLTTSSDDAAEFIRRGGIVAFPTETVYGLGAAVFDEFAIERIFAAKQRPVDNPLIAHIADIKQIADLAVDINESAQLLMDTLFPGPLTVVVRKSLRVPLIATAGLDTIGIRQPQFELARRFLLACGTPVVAPSANLSGRPSPTTWQAVAEDLDGRIDCILQSVECEIGIESTVVDCTADVPRVLRSGSMTLERLREILPEIEIAHAVNTTSPKSPGMRHRHYSPRARVVLVDDPNEIIGEPDFAYIGLRPPSNRRGYERVCASIEEYAHALFEFFRESDRLGVQTIHCERVEETGLGVALMDRLLRAAER